MGVAGHNCVHEATRVPEREAEHSRCQRTLAWLAIRAATGRLADCARYALTTTQR
jgi:hypothetical protein